jgi:hypothetical protein
VLAGLFVTPAVTEIMAALASARADGALAVVGNARLATALGEAGGTTREVIPVGVSARAAKKLPRAIADLTSVGDGALAAVIGVELASDDGWQATIRTWTRVVRDGGAIVFVDRGKAHEASRRALCGGLCEIEQRHAGRVVITSGLISHF